MIRKALLVTRVVGFFLLFTVCFGQNVTLDRKPAVAGQFYPADKTELAGMLNGLFAESVPSQDIQNVVAIVSPHAGYVFSGEVAASAFNQIDPLKQYENIFILGPSHHVGFEGASIYTQGNFITPLGTVRVNTALATQLIEQYPVFSDRTDAHLYEHSVEVQIPFLQHRLKKNFQIVPIVVGATTSEVCMRIASALKPYLVPKSLFIISTDFSHYPAYEAALEVDKATADAICSNSIKKLADALHRNDARKIPNLSTSLCGWSCVQTLLFMTEGNPAVSFHKIRYENSGDVAIGDKNRVVGYEAIAVSLNEKTKTSTFQLSENDKRNLLRMARQTVEEYVRHRRLPPIDTIELSGTARMNCGAFVTLHKHGELRGCIGRFDANEPLYRVVQQMAVAASTEDHRFLPVELNEVAELDIEISVLTPMRKIASIDEIELGKHGIYIRKGSRSGTFLPQVAAETGWSKEEFLGHCAQDKAGIGWDGWKDAELYVYEAYVFGERETAMK